ncbi:MAG: maleylpyruvate isomerase N-terminal domain-containing protein, partial [Acidimicrobiales bacterium]
MRASEAHIDLFRRGEAFVLAQMATLGDDDLREACALPGWTRAHLLAHLAGNADAMGNLLTWARTGVVTPMYTSQEQRDDDIEAGARQASAALCADLEAASARLVAAVDELP